MQILHTENLNPKRFELGTTLSLPNRSIELSSQLGDDAVTCEFVMNPQRMNKKLLTRCKKYLNGFF